MSTETQHTESGSSPPQPAEQSAPLVTILGVNGTTIDTRSPFFNRDVLGSISLTVQGAKPVTLTAGAAMTLAKLLKVVAEEK